MKIMMHIWERIWPVLPKVSATTALYVVALAAAEYLRRKPSEASVRTPVNMIRRSPGIKPVINIVAGNAIIPAPTILVDMLNTPLGKLAEL